MTLLECLRDMYENVIHHFPLLEPSLTPSRLPKPNDRKTLFSKQKVFILENVLPSFGKYIRIPSEANYWIIFSKQSWVSLRYELLDHSPRKFSIFHFSFLSCHALTPNFLGCPGAYEMHYVISKQFMLIYKSCMY